MSTYTSNGAKAISETAIEGHRVPLLAQMPNGEAFKADQINAVRIVEDETLIGSARPLFAVKIDLENRGEHCIGSGLDGEEAKRMAMSATKEINACLLPRD